MSNYWKAQKRAGVKEIFPSMATVQKPGGGRKISPKKTKDKSKVDLLKSEANILTSKAKGATKLAADVKANPEIFKQGKAFKEGLGKFGFNKPSGKK
tara:strand:+ start:57 stop:347 length:291 start_codon:yes stop_codon:yes gene_type:complete